MYYPHNVHFQWAAANVGRSRGAKDGVARGPGAGRVCEADAYGGICPPTLLLNCTLWPMANPSTACPIGGITVHDSTLALRTWISVCGDREYQGCSDQTGKGRRDRCCTPADRLIRQNSAAALLKIASRTLAGEIAAQGRQTQRFARRSRADAGCVEV